MQCERAIDRSIDRSIDRACDRCFLILAVKRYGGRIGRHSTGIVHECADRRALPLTDFFSGRMDPRGDTTRRESRFRRRCQSRHDGYKSDYRNIANVIFSASGRESSHIGDSVY